MADLKQGFCEVAFNFTKRGSVIPVEELQGAIEHAQQNRKELFRSYFTCDESATAYCQEKKSMAGYSGPWTLSSIVLDLDKAKDTDERLHEKAKGFFLELQEDFDLHSSQIRIWYSGSGFHFEIPDIFNFGVIKSTQSVKFTLAKYFPSIDDLWYPTSLIRAPWTLNKKTNRYKVLITPDMLLQGSINDIIVLSETMPMPQILPEWDELAEVPDWHDKIIKKEEIKLPKLEAFKTSETSRMITCVQKMYTEGPKVGERHNTIMRMTSSFRRAGVPKMAIISMVQAWDPTLAKDEIAKYVSDVFDKGYKWGCNDPLMSKHCDPQCQFFKKKNYSLDTHDSVDMLASYKKYVKDLSSSRILNLNQIYKLKSEFKFLPGEFICVIGDTGIGKTAWVQNIAIAFGVKTLYISLEVHEALLFRRFIQISQGLTKDEVDSAFININDAILNSMVKRIEHIKVVTTPPTLSAIEKLINEEKPQLIVIDTLDGLDVDGATITDTTRQIANELKRIANATSSVIIGIHHISKSAAIDEKGGRRHLTVHSSMGSAAIEHKADKVVGIEADAGNGSPLRHITSLKARDEAPFLRLPFHFDWNTFRYEHMIPQLILGGQIQNG